MHYNTLTITKRKEINWIFTSLPMIPLSCASQMYGRDGVVINNYAATVLMRIMMFQTNALIYCLCAQ